MGAALGLARPRIPATLGHLNQADLDHETDQRSMNAALWQVGWGYFLTNMIGAETGLSVASVDWARTHYLTYLRAGGPYPPLRVGRQPYGVLPVTSLDLWAPAASEKNPPQETWLKSFLIGVRDNVWRPALSQAPRVGLRAADPDADLVDVMQPRRVLVPPGQPPRARTPLPGAPRRPGRSWTSASSPPTRTWSRPTITCSMC